jgi:nucleoside-diphosphate-sugar epimerase
LVNTTYAANLASAASGAGVKKFVFISSLAALGPALPGQAVITESQLPKPVTTYGRSKMIAESHLRVFEMAGLPLVVLRPTAVYGPRDKDIFIILKTFDKGLEPYIGRSPQQLSFVYVTDLARAAVQLLLSGAVGSFNISDGNSYDRYALANITKKLLGRKTLKLHLPVLLVKGIACLLQALARKGTTPALNKEKLAELTAANWNCSIEKLKQAIGYQPEYDLEKGLAETMAWYKENKWI